MKSFWLGLIVFMLSACDMASPAIEDVAHTADVGVSDSRRVCWKDMRCVRFVSWNAHNFFDLLDDPRTKDTVVSRAEFDAKLERLRAGIASLSADVVALQEVENEWIVRQLAMRSVLNMSPLWMHTIRAVSMSL